MVPQDIPQVVAVANSLPDAPHWPAGVYQDMLDPARQPARICTVAEEPDGRIAGFAITVLIPPQAELEAIAVTAQRQRQGIARNLWSDLLAKLKKNDITEVTLEVRESNRAARSFYASLGFVEWGRRHGYYAENQEDAILLRRNAW
jgi:ribosomal-protein-alanine N-acetyltransferase